MSSLDENEKETRAFPRWLVTTTILLGLGVAGSVAALVHQHGQLVSAHTEMAGLRNEIAQVRQEIGTTDSRMREQVQGLNDELDAARRHADMSASQAQINARRQAQALVNKIATSEQENHKKFTAELDQLKDNSEQTSARLTGIGSEVGEVKTEVTGVKTQVASTRTDLDKTISDLHRVNGDMGVMSGLIATNAKELNVLKALGERDYYEFSLSKAQSRRLLAGVNLVYRKADPKRNRFTVEVIADDKRVEKKDRTVNEPVQFYVPSKARQPYEIVINQVKKDTIVGYMAVPKPQQIAQR